MKRYLIRFLVNEIGAVSVDFVILTAAAAGLGTVALSFIGPGAVELADRISVTVANH